MCVGAFQGAIVRVLGGVGAVMREDGKLRLVRGVRDRARPADRKHRESDRKNSDDEPAQPQAGAPHDRFAFPTDPATRQCERARGRELIVASPEGAPMPAQLPT